ncbi:MAG: hypothetical protein GY842_16365, partial [bacterium]|nr:hypothetical protein [bacterium]
LPEWGIRHSTYPQFSNKWLPTLYRSVAGPPFHGLALPALLMDARELWNHDAFFDYTDRYMGFSASGGYSGYTRTQNSFTTNMWDAYRSQCGPVWSGSEADSAPVTPPDDGSDDGTPANSEPPETDPISGAAPLPQDEPPSLELVEPRDGDIVTGVVAIQVEATDAEDTPGTLLVEICIDSELWLEAVYSGVSGMYHVRWDATDWADGLEHTIFARATDHAPEQNTTDTSPVTVVVQPATMHVASIAVTGTQNGVSARRIQAVVAVVDGKGNPVPQALVIGTFEGVAVESASGLTNARGVAVLSGPEESGVAGPTRFYLDEVTHSGYEYRPDQNAVNAGSTAD